MLAFAAFTLALGAFTLAASSGSAEDAPSAATEAPATGAAAAEAPATGAAAAEAPATGAIRQPLRPTGSVTVELTNISVGVAVNWGRGVLTFQSRNYPFRVRGLGIVGVGGSSIKATGTVFNLDRVEDFPGSWAKIDGAAVLGRASSGGVSLSNGPSVMILTGTQKGARLGAGGGAVRIELLDPSGDSAESEEPAADAE